ncbi:DUF1543 domain-containing protein [Flavobacterium rhizosphaerae]|uniref:DUF1543 domain-containing protein n=1 Tax=Flavobacterium rhizosphaerae TaxID=3163298 RepID=A0ABW8YY38_9FLAO
MEKQLKLFMVLLGCTPQSRVTEQHDIFFGIGESLSSLKEDMYAFWPEGGDLHIDSWRAVTHVGGYDIHIVPKKEMTEEEKLFFLNLGGYKPGDPEEYHYKMLAVAPAMSTAVKAAKQTAFYKHYGFKGAESHIDEKYALDVDDMHKVEDLIPTHLKELYSITIHKNEAGTDDEYHIGYLKISKL